MFVEKADLKSHIYGYQVDEITGSDDDIVTMACSAAEDELRSYLMARGKEIERQYDADAILSATGAARNALLLQLCKSIAVYHLIQLCNVDILYEQAKERYDRAVAWLRGLRKGDTTLNLPTVNPDATTDDSLPWRMGSRAKFAHE